MESSIQKWGKKRGVQEYKCTKCLYRFRNKKRIQKNNKDEEWYYKYAVNQRTLADISSEMGVSIKALQKRFDDITPYTGEVFPVENKREVVVMDASHIGCNEILTLLRNTNKQSLHWKWSSMEKVEYYRRGLKELESLGYIFYGFVIDGKRGVKEMLEREYPGVLIQHCQFHQIQTIKGYIPRKVKSEAGRMLRSIALRITKMYSIQFNTAIDIWTVLYEDFLKERSFSITPEGKKSWWYTHKRIRSAYRSIQKNLPYLFSFEKSLGIQIPNTTNICDGYFSHLKNRLNRHRGLHIKRKKKMANFLLSLDLPVP